MSYEGRQVIVTGGTGALGSAVVGALVEVGATCYVPWRRESEAAQFAYREHDQVKLLGSIDLTDEASVNRLFGEVPALWASIHVAGGFAMGAVAKTGKADLMHLLDMNFVSCFLCCSSHGCRERFRAGNPRVPARALRRDRSSTFAINALFCSQFDYRTGEFFAGRPKALRSLSSTTSSRPSSSSRSLA